MIKDRPSEVAGSAALRSTRSTLPSIGARPHAIRISGRGRARPSRACSRAHGARRHDGFACRRRARTDRFCGSAQARIRTSRWASSPPSSLRTPARFEAPCSVQTAMSSSRRRLIGPRGFRRRGIGSDRPRSRAAARKILGTGFSPQDRAGVATASADGTAGVWDSAPGELRAGRARVSADRVILGAVSAPTAGAWRLGIFSIRRSRLCDAEDGRAFGEPLATSRSACWSQSSRPVRVWARCWRIAQRLVPSGGLRRADLSTGAGALRRFDHDPGLRKDGLRRLTVPDRRDGAVS